MREWKAKLRVERGKTGEWRGENMGVERGRLLDSEDRRTMERPEDRGEDCRRQETGRQEKGERGEGDQRRGERVRLESG